eukprot:3198047-Prorocentrum_lima.AAC.1
MSASLMTMYSAKGHPYGMRTPQFDRIPASTGDGHYLVVKDPTDFQNIVGEGVIGHTESRTAVA